MQPPTDQDRHARERNATGDSHLRWLLPALLGLHLALLVASLPDYRVTADSAFHVAMGRQYATHGAYYRDLIHYQPAGRPNLYAPLVHVAIGVLGRALGGEGEDYVLANALLGLLLWVVALGTAVHFARLLGGARAGLLAGTVLAGSAFASGSFYVNLPSAWMLVFTPWALHDFLEGRVVRAVTFTSLACYASLGGFATVPLGLILAATATRKPRRLLAVGVGAALVTAPYWVHVLRSLAWYTSQRGDSTWWIDPLVDLFWVVGVAWAVRARPRPVFLLAWAAAPLPWLVYDASRFIVQSSLAGSVVGAVAVAAWIERSLGRDGARRLTLALVATATLLPLGIPGLGGEIAWLVKPYPRVVDWDETRALAGVVRERGLEGRLVRAYVGHLVSGLSVWADVRGAKGHWYEVRPVPDPADTLPVARFLYVMGAPASDSALTDWAGRGRLIVHGGGSWSSLVELVPPAAPQPARTELTDVWAGEAAWIAERCEHNGLGNWVTLYLDGAEIPRRARARGECRTRVARMQLVLMRYLATLEETDPERAHRLRRLSDQLFWMQAVVGDPMALDYRTRKAHARMRADMAEMAGALRGGITDDELEDLLSALLGRYLGASRGKLF